MNLNIECMLEGTGLKSSYSLDATNFAWSVGLLTDVSQTEQF